MTHIFTYAEQVACVSRELRERKRVYARLVSQGSMARTRADREIAVMTAVLATVQERAVAERLL